MIKIGIVGYGTVGKAVGQFAIKDKIKVVPYDLGMTEYATPQNMLAAFNSDFVFVCLPTPLEEDGRMNVDLIVDAAKKWTDVCLNEESILVIKSTVPPGCVEELCELFETDRIIFNPEFLSAKTSLRDFIEMDDIIIGGAKTATYKLKELYQLWGRDHPLRHKFLITPINDKIGSDFPTPRYTLTDTTTAEIAKMARNSFYAMKVSFMNEIYELCQTMDINYSEFREMFAFEGRQSWINPQHTFVPGPDGQLGFGGACLPKDSSGFASLADSYGVSLSILKAAIQTNKRKRDLDD